MGHFRNDFFNFNPVGMREAHRRLPVWPRVRPELDVVLKYSERSRRKVVHRQQTRPLPQHRPHRVLHCKPTRFSKRTPRIRRRRVRVLPGPRQFLHRTEVSRQLSLRALCPRRSRDVGERPGFERDRKIFFSSANFFFFVRILPKRKTPSWRSTVAPRDLKTSAPTSASWCRPGMTRNRSVITVVAPPASVRVKGRSTQWKWPAKVVVAVSTWSASDSSTSPSRPSACTNSGEQAVMAEPVSTSTATFRPSIFEKI